MDGARPPGGDRTRFPDCYEGGDKTTGPAMLVAGNLDDGPHLRIIVRLLQRRTRMS